MRWLALVVLAGCSSCSTRLTPYAKGLAFTGRIDTRDEAGPRFAWSGTRLRLAFTGPSIRLVVKTTVPPGAKDHFPSRFRADLDGAVSDTRAGANGEWVFAAGNLSSGTHDLTVYQQSEALNGANQLVAIELDKSGRLLPAPEPEPRRLEIIGDSISTAYGIEGKDEKCDYDTATQSHWDSYGAIAARDLGAQLHTVAWSGRGLVRNYDADDAQQKTMPVLWRRTLPSDESSTWDADGWEPDATMIVLGGNDFAKGDPGGAFIDAAESLMKAIREKYPDTRVLAVLHAQSTDDFPPGVPERSKLRAYYGEALERRRKAGDTKVGLIELSQRKLPDDGLGCQYHPSRLTQQKMAAELTASLRSLLGW